MSDPDPGEPQLESPAARIISALLDGGDAVDEGGFTLDPGAAAAKLASFAYADRSPYLLPIVEALHRLGAREVALETRREDLLIRGRGLRLVDPKGSLRDIYTHAIGSGSSSDEHARALARLGLGIDMILGAEGTQGVQVAYSSPSTAVVAQYRWGAAPELSESAVEVIGELRIVIDHRRIWRLRRPAADPNARALAHLRDALHHSEHAVTLDGRPISQHPRDWFEILRGEGPGYRITAGLEQVGELSSMIELWTAGVYIESQTTGGIAFQAVIDLAAPRRDLSQLRVVADATVEQALAAVELVRGEALARLERADASWTDANRPRAWPRARVNELLGRPEQPEAG